MQSDGNAISCSWKCALSYENGRVAGLDFRGAQSPRGRHLRIERREASNAARCATCPYTDIMASSAKTGITE